MYNVGNIKGFVDAYKKYGNTDALYDNYLCKPTTSNGKQAAGLVKRRKAEWDLFCNGYGGNGSSQDGVGSGTSQGGQYASIILQKAKECHDYVKNNGYTYEQIGLSIPITNNSVKKIDCSSYVSWVLYEAGFTQFKGHQHTSGSFAKNPYSWEKISRENLQAGDIMVYRKHVQIYAGNRKYYSCGSTDSIKIDGWGTSIDNSDFLFGLRP